MQDIIEPESGQLAELPTHPMAIIARAIERGVDADNLAKLMDLQTKWEDRRAAEEFAIAIANFQREVPMVFKSREVRKKDGGVMYFFASYDDIKRVTRPIEAKYGISTSFDIQHTEDGKLIGKCRVRVGSHFEDHTFTVPVPKGLNTNQTQDYGGALTYLKRYCYCAALDIVVTDEDTDAANLTDLIGPDQLKEVVQLIQEKGVAPEKFKAWCSEAAGVDVPTLEAIPLRIVDKAIDLLRRKPVKAGGK